MKDWGRGGGGEESKHTKTYDRKIVPSTGMARAVTALTWPLNT